MSMCHVKHSKWTSKLVVVLLAAAHLRHSWCRRQLAEVGEVLSSGQKPAAKRPPQALPSGDLAFGRLDVGKSESG